MSVKIDIRLGIQETKMTWNQNFVHGNTNTEKCIELDAQRNGFIQFSGIQKPTPTPLSIFDLAINLLSFCVIV